MNEKLSISSERCFIILFISIPFFFIYIIFFFFLVLLLQFPHQFNLTIVQPLLSFISSDSLFLLLPQKQKISLCQHSPFLSSFFSSFPFLLLVPSCVCVLSGRHMYEAQWLMKELFLGVSLGGRASIFIPRHNNIVSITNPASARGNGCCSCA